MMLIFIFAALRGIGFEPKAWAAELTSHPPAGVRLVVLADHALLKKGTDPFSL
jgi:hypothetical protein